MDTTMQQRQHEVARQIAGMIGNIPAPTARDCEYATGASHIHYQDVDMGDGSYMPRSYGPAENQFDAGYDLEREEGHTWSNIFGDDPGIPPPDMTETHREETSDMIHKKAMMFDWLSACIKGDASGLLQTASNPWNRAKTSMLMKVAKDEAAAMGKAFPYKTRPDPEGAFALDYIHVLIGGSNPPEILWDFPGFVPAKEHKDTAGSVKKGKLSLGLKKVFTFHMAQYNQKRSWISKERDLLRWYNKMDSDGRQKKEGRTIESLDIEPYTRCKMQFCNWTISGINKEFIQIPDKWNPATGEPKASSYAKQYAQPMDLPNGRIMATTDHRDDGRGDEGRLERYKQAMKDHKSFAHTYDPKKAINVNPPTFKMKMTPDEFEDQKEGWRRFCITHPDNTPELYYDMLKQSIDRELFLIIKSEMTALKSKADEAAVTRIMKVIEKNAVVKVPNDVYMTAFDKIKQEEGEKVEPYLSRLRTAALKVEMKRKGRCTVDTHPGEPEIPCKKSITWTTAVAAKELEDEDSYISDDSTIIVGGVAETCPECCKDVEDTDRKNWMIKKHFLNHLRVDNHKKQIMLRLQQSFTGLKLKSKFDALKFNLGHITMVATQIEEIYENDKKNLGPRDNNLNSGGARDENPGRGGQGGRGGKTKRGGKQSGQGGRGGKNQNSEKKTGQKNSPGVTLEGKCSFCGENPHGPTKEGKPTNPQEDRKKHCKAWDKPCHNCGRTGHLSKVCRSKPKSGGAEAQEGGEKPQQKGDSTKTTAEGAGGNTRSWTSGPFMEPLNTEWTKDYGAESGGSFLSTLKECVDDETEEELRARQAAKNKGMFGCNPPQTEEKGAYPNLPPEETIDQQERSPRQMYVEGKQLTKEISFNCGLLQRKTRSSWDNEASGNGRRGGAKRGH